MSKIDFECFASTGVKSPRKAKWPELAEGNVVYPKCAEILDAKWAVFSCAAKYSRAGFAMCKLLTWQLSEQLQPAHIG